MSTRDVAPRGRAPAATSTAAGWIFGGLMVATGVANLVLVHPVPAVAYGIVSLVYLPPAGAVLRRRVGWSIHPLAKAVLAVAVVAFTLGVSDLGDMIDGS